MDFAAGSLPFFSPHSSGQAVLQFRKSYAQAVDIVKIIPKRLSAKRAATLAHRRIQRAISPLWMQLTCARHMACCLLCQIKQVLT
ncbi:hypothetical protein [Pseudophaeobacter sp.]|uniref:hypothetical protein n=1 Tax=Pseudophaeobacter sp. TaxID=1971739 RepID=UPI003265F1A5